MGDQLSEIQQTSRPFDRIKQGSFKIDVLFNYTDDSESVLEWCQGTVINIVSENDSYIVLKVKWNDECLRDDKSQTANKKLKIHLWNPKSHKKGVWRENLHHKLIQIETPN